MQKRRKKLIIITILIVLLLSSILYYEYIVSPLVNSIATEEIRSQVIDIINYANTYLQSLSLFYNDYFTIYYDNDNNVSAIVANTGLINQVNMILQKQVQDQLNELRTKKISMPAGAFTGSSLIATFGVSIPINVQTICNCYSSFTNTFESVGINQVRHSLVITLNIDVEVLIPLRSEVSNAYNDLIMAESIIVGEVPQTYLTGDSSDLDYLDLVP